MSINEIDLEKRLKSLNAQFTPQAHYEEDIDFRSRALGLEETRDILGMRKHWSTVLLGILIFEIVAAFVLLLLIGFYPSFGERLGNLVVETYIIKHVSEVIGMLIIVIKFLFGKKN